MGDLPAASGLPLLPALITVSIVSGRLPGNSAAAAATAAALEGSFISSDTSAGGAGHCGAEVQKGVNIGATGGSRQQSPPRPALSRPTYPAPWWCLQAKPMM
jgi:hypothetical protein